MQASHAAATPQPPTRQAPPADLCGVEERHPGLRGQREQQVYHIEALAKKERRHRVLAARQQQPGAVGEVDGKKEASARQRVDAAREAQAYRLAAYRAGRVGAGEIRVRAAQVQRECPGQCAVQPRAPRCLPAASCAAARAARRLLPGRGSPTVLYSHCALKKSQGAASVPGGSSAGPSNQYWRLTLDRSTVVLFWTLRTLRPKKGRAGGGQQRSAGHSSTRLAAAAARGNAGGMRHGARKS